MKRSVTELGNGRNVENLWGNGTWREVQSYSRCSFWSLSDIVMGSDLIVVLGWVCAVYGREWKLEYIYEKQISDMQVHKGFHFSTSVMSLATRTGMLPLHLHTCHVTRPMSSNTLTTRSSSTILLYEALIDFCEVLQYTCYDGHAQ